MTNTANIQRKFEAIGACARFGVLPQSFHARARRGDITGRRILYTVDLSKGVGDQLFEIRVSDLDKDKVDISVLDIQPQDRHLLLMAKEWTSDVARPLVHKFLCGHDERFWFVAGVPTEGISTVMAAKEALKPAAVRRAELQYHVKTKNRQRRKNTAFVRQGEWFFIPAPDLVVDARSILYHEPLRRGAGKPHVAACLLRRGGTQVYVCNQFPNGLTDEERVALLTREPAKKMLRWRPMVRDPKAYVKGRITHSDHKTVVLSCWHRVIPNAEVASRNVAFLD